MNVISSAELKSHNPPMNNSGKRTMTDLTKGDPLKVITLFALPLFLSNILQQLYNLTDIAIIGHVLGDDALSAIGSVSTIYGFYNSLFFGMGSGFSLVTAKYFGAGDREGLKKVMGNTLILFVAWAVLITSVGMISLKPIMTRLEIPEDIFDTAYGYISVMLSLAVFSFAYNVLSGTLRAIGNSRVPLYILAVTVVLNIGLDLLFVYKLELGLPGAAYATVISQAVSALVCLLYILFNIPELRIGTAHLRPDIRILVDLFSSGIGFALMYTVVNLGTLVLQGAINGMGKTVIAAHTTARKVSALCMMMVGTLANAMATYAGQNYGAGKIDRIREGLKKSLIFDFCIVLVLILMVYTVGTRLIALISGSSNPEVLDTAAFYLKLDIPFYFVLCILLVTRSVLQGVGSKFVPVIASLVELILKVYTAKKLSLILGYLGVAICEPATWLICAVFVLLVFRWRMNKINKELSSGSHY